MMQMSRHSLFVFTEGFKDRYLYDCLVQRVCKKHGITCSLRTAEEIPGGGGGKTAVLEFFTYARRNSLLDADFKGKRTICAFLLDKDLDDVRRTQRKSPHVIYTPTYELENLLFLNSNLSAAAAAAASLDPSTFGNTFANPITWCKRAAGNWQKWVTLCAFSHLRAENAGNFYGRPRSQINSTAYSPTNDAAFQYEVLRFKDDWSDGDSSFYRAFSSIERRVERAYNQGDADRFFKGKWYCYFAREDVQRLARGRRWIDAHFGERLLCCLVMTIDPARGWPRWFLGRIDALI
jgi:hypothetical protein